VAVLVTSFAADATVHAASPASIRQVLSKPVLNPTSAEPATPGLREFVDPASVRIDP
jgi:hypothetical protein